jgi:beta-xylosidase
MPFAMQNFVIRTTDIWGGEWSDPVPIDFAGLDPGLFFDDDGNVYFHGCFNLDRTKQPSGTIKQMQINLHTGKPLSELREIWGGHFRHDTEGPHIYKRGAWYYLLVAEGSTFKNHALCIARSKNIWGPYESFSGNPVLTARDTAELIQNTGHGDMFQDKEGNWGAAVLGVRDCNRDGFAPLGRETFLTPVEWPEDGWPTFMQPHLSFHEKSTATGQQTLPDDLMGRIPANIGLLFIRNPRLEDYILPTEARSRYLLRPSSTDISASTGTCSFVGQRQRSLNIIATTTIHLNSDAKRSSTEAGLALYKDHLRHISIAYNFQANKLVLRVKSHTDDRKESKSISHVAESEASELGLRLVVTPKIYSFEVETGDSWEEALTVEAKDLICNEMTGPIIGIFARTDEEEYDGHVGFSDFTLEDLPERDQ